MKTITAEMLVEAGACDVDEFRERFPDGVTFESEEDAIAQCVAVAGAFNWEWAARNLLSDPAWRAFKRDTATAWKAFMEATDPTWNAYREATDQAAQATAWKAFMEADATAAKAYRKAEATAFARGLWRAEA